MSNPSTPHQEPAQPAGPASLKWCYPFPDRNGKEITDPQDVYSALARMEDGFFPLGVNGFPHGGVHFGEGSTSLLDQSGGARSIANGEIVAYRIDEAYPQLHFTQNGRWAMYSTGFVLMRHRMTLPPAPGSTGPQPSDETLTFYSLYMHLADWATYLSNDTLKRPGWWLGVEAYRIQGKDQQNGGGSQGALVRTAPKAGSHGRFTAGEPVGFLPEASEVTIGERRGEWGHIKEIRAGGMLSPTSGALFGSDDLSAPWVRPDDDRAELATLTTEGDWGWINLHDNECLTEPNPLGTTVTRPQMERIPVSAGTLLGQIGEYHDYERSTPLPPVAKRQLLHLEVFAGNEFKAFLEKSRARAAQLPADQYQRTMLLIQPGAKLVKEAFAPNLKLGDASHPLAELKPTADSPGDGPWVKVQPMRKEDIFTLPDGAPVWVERKQADQFKSPSNLPAWSVFPLQVKFAATPVDGQALAFPRAHLDGQKAESRAVDDKGTHWWRVLIGKAEGGSDWGWVCEKAHPGTVWESPWAWPGFEIVDATCIQLTDAFRRNLSVTGSADWKEQKEFEPSTQVVNGSELLKRLEQTVSRLPVPYGHKKPEPGPDGRDVVTARKLQQALNTRWLASELGHVILQSESEWGGNMTRWEAISPLMRNARENWTCELQRIKKLQWWDEVKGKVEGFPASPVVHHIHPVALVGNFAHKQHIDIEKFIALYKAAHSNDFGWYDKAHGPKSSLPPLSEQSEANLRTLMTWIDELYISTAENLNIGYVAYMLATARVESYDFHKGIFFGPVSEGISYADAEANYGCGATASKAHKDRAIVNENTEIGDGYKYRGRGLVQITFKKRYRVFSPITGSDLVKNPDDALVWSHAVNIMVHGMLNGKFSGFKLSDFISDSQRDYLGARRIINGTDKNDIFAEYAKKFEALLKECS
jgi:hypothetical protein